jgi:hypothetical protein
MAGILNSAPLDMSAQYAGDPIVKGNFGILILPTNVNSYIGLGGSLDLGFYVSERSYLLLDGGYYANVGNENQIGTFSYLTSDRYGNVHINDNGIIKRSHTLIPAFLSWNRKFQFSDNVSFHIGPSIGVTTVTAYDRYTVNGEEWIPDIDLGERERPSHREYMALFGVGVNADLCFIRLSDDSVLGIGYRYLRNSRRSFGSEIFSGATHQITLTVLFGE